MSTQTLLLVRGLPGSGKSTMARTRTDTVFEADQYFVDRAGVYQFDPTKLYHAHCQCERRTREALEAGVPVVAVANTFVRARDMRAYKDMAAELGVTVEIINVFDGGLTDAQLAKRNLHSVPVEAIAKMRARWSKNA